jgi:four helix bundle protein
MVRTHFETLRVYQLSETLADQIWKVVCGWSAFAKDTVGKQMVRAADSIGANLAEGTGKGALLDHRRFVRVARGSLYETKHWLRRAYVRKLLSTKDTESLKITLDELTRTLNGYLRSLNRRSATKPADKSSARFPLKPKI